VIHCFGLACLWNRFRFGLHANRGRNGRNVGETIDLKHHHFRHLGPSHAAAKTRKVHIKVHKSRGKILLWIGSSSEHVSMSPWTKTEDGMTEMARILLIREHPDFRHLRPSHAAANAQISYQIAREPRMIHCLGLVCLWNIFRSLLHAKRGRNDRIILETIDLKHHHFRHLGPSYSTANVQGPYQSARVLRAMYFFRAGSFLEHV
jgi:hypothetical protein